jgi:5-methylcytosine-specific restriction endonuclease McrA
MKICRKCSGVLIVGKNITALRFSHGDYICKDCTASYARSRYATYRKQYNEDNANQIKKYQREYGSSEQGRMKHEANHARRRQSLQVSCEHSSCVSGIDRRAVWGRDEGCCRIKLVCNGDFVPFEEMHLDHVIPLSKSGLHCLYNVQTGCSQCNRSKHAKLIEAMM